MSGLAINLRGVRKQDGERIERDQVRSLFDVVGTVKVSIINARDVNLSTATFNRVRLIYEHSDAHFFQIGHHAN
jgi:hypothetical protein